MPAAGAVAYTLGGGHRTYAPRDEAPVHYQYATLTICNVTASKPTTTPRPVHMAGRSVPITAATTNEEQQLLLLLPRRRRRLHGRQRVEMRRVAGPPCTFRYARPMLIYRH